VLSGRQAAAVRARCELASRSEGLSGELLEVVLPLGRSPLSCQDCVLSTSFIQTESPPLSVFLLRNEHQRPLLQKEEKHLANNSFGTNKMFLLVG
jgi:hypothetical protein